MRKILIFSPVYYPRFVGGAEVAIKEITDRFPPGEAEFDMVTLRLSSDLPRFEKIGNVNVYRVGWSKKGIDNSGPLPWYIGLNKYLFLLLGPLKAVSLDRKRNYSTIWSLLASYGSFAALFFKLIKPTVRFVFTLQDGDPVSYLKRRALPLYPFFKMIFTRADHIQAISRYLAEWAKDMGAKSPISLVPNAVDQDLFSRKDDPLVLSKIASDLGKKPGDIMLVTTSRLVIKNAVGDIIEALKYLPKNVKLLVIGEGHLESDLKDDASRYKLSDRVIFLGHVSHEELPKYLQISDIFVRPSLSEGLGNSFLEAMAADVPVIGTPVGGIPDFLRDGETGLFCEVNNPKSIAQKVEKLIRDRESRDYIVEQARDMVKERYTWEKIAGEMQKILC